MTSNFNKLRTPNSELRTTYEGTTTRNLAQAAGVAEAKIFRHFASKKAILMASATQGWIEILTDLLTELSEMASYKAVAQMMRRRMLNLPKNNDLLGICFMEAQLHPDLRDRIQSEVIVKMTDVTEAFIQTGIDRGIYRPMNQKIVAQVFLGMFTIDCIILKLKWDKSAEFKIIKWSKPVGCCWLHRLLVGGAHPTLLR